MKFNLIDVLMYLQKHNNNGFHVNNVTEIKRFDVGYRGDGEYDTVWKITLINSKMSIVLIQDGHMKSLTTFSDWKHVGSKLIFDFHMTPKDVATILELENPDDISQCFERR